MFGALAQGSAPMPTGRSLLLPFAPGFLLEDFCSCAFPRISCPEIIVRAVCATDANTKICTGSVNIPQIHYEFEKAYHNLEKQFASTLLTCILSYSDVQISQS